MYGSRPRVPPLVFGNISMNKLSFTFDAKHFASTFRAAGDDSSAARSEQDVVIWLEGGVGSAGAGFTWGRGQVSFQGRDHAFRASSFSITDAGAAAIYATGRVMRLRRISDLNGNYRTSSAGATTAGASLATYLQNERGVVIELVAMDAATAANRTVNGVRVRLKNA
jgi:hypothetical protein